MVPHGTSRSDVVPPYALCPRHSSSQEYPHCLRACQGGAEGVDASAEPQRGVGAGASAPPADEPPVERALVEVEAVAGDGVLGAPGAVVHGQELAAVAEHRTHSSAAPSCAHLSAVHPSCGYQHGHSSAEVREPRRSCDSRTATVETVATPARPRSARACAVEAAPAYQEVSTSAGTEVGYPCAPHGGR